MRILRNGNAAMSWCQLSAVRRQMSIWCKTRGLKCRASSFELRSHLSTKPTSWHPKLPSKEVRSIFLDYFKGKDHKFVPASSVVAKKNEGSYFINAGMNQFKPIFLDQVDAESEMGRYKRVTNSQKCIRVGGKHNDLDEVGKDTYHHTFFEMLGSWSFGDYFKEEACSMAWELLTKVYKIPPEHLFVTYFGGDEATGLAADTECRDIWLQIGVPADRLIPKGPEDNFWDMGFTGPCGPCTEIHFDYQGNTHSSKLPHLGHPDVVEIWNLVFMQYERRENGELLKLPQCHVDTGMGLERLTAVLNGTTSNYNTDLFIPLFNHLQKNGNSTPAYSDKIGSSDIEGMDTAYRIVADHARMFTVALSDGLLPGRRHVGSKLRTVMHRAFKVSQQVLGIPPGRLSGLVPLIGESLGEAFPSIVKEQSQIIEWTDHTERQYIETIEQGRKMVQKALKKFNSTSLTGEQIHEIIEGRFGQAVSLDNLIDLAEDFDVQLSLGEYEKVLETYKTVDSPLLDQVNEEALDPQDLRDLAAKGVPPTDDDLKYSYEKRSGSYALPNCESKVLALQTDGEFSSLATEGATVGIILDKTSFYAESGGQVADRGQLISSSGSAVEINDVQRFGDYVLHIGTVTKGQIKLSETLTQTVDIENRVRCMRGHTATHVINFALEKILGGVVQQGSNVSSQKLTFDFSCKKPQVTNSEITKIETLAQQIVSESLPVHKAEVPLSAAEKINGIRLMPQAVYPSKVRVISIGPEVQSLLNDSSESSNVEHSIEFCGGTHVENSSDIGAIVITHFLGRSQGVKSLAAVTGPVALQAMEDVKQLRKMANELQDQVRSKNNPNQWAKKMAEILKFADRPVSKVKKEAILESLKHTQGKVLNEQKKVEQRKVLNNEIYDLLSNSSEQFVVANIDFGKTSEVYRVLGKMRPTKAIMLISMNKDTRKSALGICYVPPEMRDDVIQKRWAARVCEIMGGRYDQPTDKMAKKHLPESLVLTFNFSDKASLQKALQESRKYIHNTIKFKL